MKPLLQENEYLNLQYKKLKDGLTNNTILNRETENYDKIINFIQKSINNKINNVNTHSNKRSKRGLINGLGSIVKTITGNLDAEDGKRYDKILNHIQGNMKNLENQLNLQYTINDKIIERFNSTIKDIEHNDIVLKSRIIQLHNVIQNKLQQQDILFAKDIFNQLIILYNSILYVLQDIENSVTFCKLQTIHPSIIETIDLFHELQKISKFYKNQLPLELKYENILEFESLIQVNCKIEPDQITYFLSLPIDFEENYNLYYLKPIPTKHESEYVTIVPNIKYLLKLENKIIPLRDICTKNTVFQCPNHLISRNNANCEEQIILQNNPQQCQYTRISIRENQIEFIFEINQYLAVFSKDEKFISQCEGQTETKSLNGIFLIKNNNCKLFLNKEEITYNEKSYGTPLIINGLHFNISKTKISNFTIELKTLKLENIPNPAVVHQETFRPRVHSQPSLWTIIIYIIIVIGICFLAARWLKNRKLRKIEKQEENSTPERDQRKSTLPEEVSFQQGRSYLTTN